MPSTDSTLLAACAAYHTATAEIATAVAAGGCPDADMDAMTARQAGQLRTVTAIRPATPAGIRAKAGVAHAAMSWVAASERHDTMPAEEAAALSVLADMLAAA